MTVECIYPPAEEKADKWPMKEANGLRCSKGGEQVPAGLQMKGFSQNATGHTQEIPDTQTWSGCSFLLIPILLLVISVRSVRTVNR